MKLLLAFCHKHIHICSSQSKKIMANSTTSSSGIGFTGLLTIVFIVLKLTHTIDWSWWWVLSPIWISILLVILIVIVAAIISK